MATKVSDLMVRSVEFIAPESSVQHAAQLMGELDVSALPVGTAEELRSVVTDRDILYRLVAEGRDPKRTSVMQIASTMLFTCRADDSLRTAMDLIAAHQVRRLPVVNDAGHVIGWITLSDISRHLLVESEAVQRGLQALTEEPAAPPESA